MTGFIQIQVTFPDADEARRTGERLVRDRLVACAQVLGPIHSCYRWRGKVETGGEYLMLAKTRAALFDTVAGAIAKSHSYTCPQIVAVPLVHSAASYLAWLDEETGPGPEESAEKPAEEFAKESGEQEK